MISRGKWGHHRTVLGLISHSTSSLSACNAGLWAAVRLIGMALDGMVEAILGANRLIYTDCHSQH